MPVLNSIHTGKEFFCPNCLVTRPYDLKPMSKDITLYPIPVLEANETNHVFECQACRNAFNPQVLRRYVQILYTLAGTAKCQLDQGISPGYLKLQLVSDGLKESFADKLIALAQHQTVSTLSA